MSRKRMYLSPPDMSGSEFEYVQQAFDSNWIAPFGPALEQLKQTLTEQTGSAFAEPVNTGTAAIHLALIAAGIQQNDIVFCPTFTFVGSVFPVLYQNATPVFIDSEITTWNMDPVLLEQAIKDILQEGEKPKAIIVVHLYGFPALLDPILKIASIYNLIVIEDAAESLGATYNGQQTGTFGLLGALSFNGNKIVTGGSGGAVLTADERLYQRICKLANQSKEDKSYYEHWDIGYNYRLSNISAAIALGQLEQLNEKITKKKYIRSVYKSLLHGAAEVKETTVGSDNAWLTCILLPSGKDPEALRLILEEHNIESRRLWNPMHRQPVFKNSIVYINGISDNLFQRGLCLPSGTALEEEDIRIVTDIMKTYL
ncbi:MAG: DegT/DnrJ/EryC1/StrS family aminotransferase [Cytophagales bacterium]|nr:DegT/DnrJ/EryC1/StrS family aminotransferase [Cytophaga sp.]